MTEEQCLLSSAEREIVNAQVRETCDHRGWTLFAADGRSSHVHVVVGAMGTDPTKIRIDLKTWCTRRLKEQSDTCRAHWWAERGSVRWVWDDDSLSTVIKYVTESQDRKGRDHL
ncbi:MAG: hypothetical protein HKN47_04520 [Pirellulaceae bacterium]|nr:hypothetical protein [Pirellulaceae bacterium]